MNKPKPHPVTVILIGTGGMGFYYLQELLTESSPDRTCLLAVVEPYPQKTELSEKLSRRRIPVFPTLQSALAAGLRADLVIVSSPLQHHVNQSLYALLAGSHVLCEKPLAATVQDADLLIRESAKTSPWIRIGYQWSYTKAIRTLKKDLMKGRFGRPLRAKALHLWPRGIDYYLRNDWAGRIRDSEGRWVLDSPAQSAMAHDLHNLLFLLGEKMDRSALPQDVLAELYRAYPIENYDTLACRMMIQTGVELLFYASHAVQDIRGPLFALEFEEAVVSFGGTRTEIVAVTVSGKEIAYGSPQNENPFKKLNEAVEAVQKPVPITCGPEAARAQTLCVNGIQESVDLIKTFPPSLLRRNENRYWAEGLPEALDACYTKGLLPSEAGYSWGRAGRRSSLKDYSNFPGGAPPLKTGGLEG